MARKTPHPGRVLLGFFVGLVIAFGLVALTGTWKPQLGLDLEGGTSIRLTPKGNPSASALNEARQIIDDRVNGSGVSEAQVTVQGNKYVVVQIPGQSRRDLVDTVRRQAQLRFRIVACSAVDPGPCATTTTTPSTGASASAGASASPSAGASGAVIAPSGSASAKASAKASGSASAKASSSASASSSATASGADNRPPADYAPQASAAASPSAATAASASTASSASAVASASAVPSDDASPADSASPSGSVSVEPSATAGGQSIEPPDGGTGESDGLTWAEQPNQASIDAYNAFTCPADGSAANVVDDPAKPLVTCGTGTYAGVKYLLSTASIEGNQINKATAEIPSGQLTWVVALDFDGAGTKAFTAISQALYGSQRQFAVVLDGQVLEPLVMSALITNGQTQIEGSFTEASAQSLATSLKFGALPVQFSDFTAETVGPSLAGDQLHAGITAGIAGLVLVMIYCLLYYRGLGIVVVGSLVVAGLATYAMVLLLARTAGFTLTLPGIAGLIVAVGITADSFIVYFERIRDEMREGRSMRVAVEAGWVRARTTCLAADAVSLLAAVVLYIFTASVVRGFAFALGLSTAIDLVVFFFFTKPLVSTLARFRFYNSGNRLSGLSAETLGVDAIAADRPRRTTIGASRGEGGL